MPNENSSNGNGRKPAEFSVREIQVSLEGKKATVSLTSSSSGQVSLHNFPFDPAGDQTESNLRKAALEEAREILKDAIKAL